MPFVGFSVAIGLIKVLDSHFLGPVTLIARAYPCIQVHGFFLLAGLGLAAGLVNLRSNKAAFGALFIGWLWGGVPCSLNLAILSL